MGVTLAERRQFARVPAHLAVLVEPRAGNPSLDCGPSEDLGPGGCLVLLDEALDPGEAVRISVAVEGLVIRADGTVVHSEPHGAAGYDTGIQFTRLSPSARAVLKRALEP